MRSTPAPGALRRSHGRPSRGRPSRPRPSRPTWALLLALTVGAGCDRGGAAPEGPRGANPPEPAAGPGGLDPATAAQPVAKVGDVTITVGDLAERILVESPYLRARYRSPERRRELLDQLIEFHLLAEEAERRGYDALPEVERVEKQAMIERLIAAHFEENRTALQVTDEEVRAHYAAHPEEWSQPEQVRASHILVEDRALAERILAELRASDGDPETWRRLAEAHHADEETRESHGDLRFFSRPEASVGAKVAEPLARAAFSLDQNGEVFPEPVRTDRGWHVVLRTGHRPALERSLDDVRRTIENQLWREKQDAAIEALLRGLRAKYAVETHPERLEQVRVPTGLAPEAP